MSSNEHKSSPIFVSSTLSKNSKEESKYSGGTGSSSEKVTLEDFKILKFIDKGNFGSVFLAYLPSKDKHFAIKCLNKDDLIENDLLESAKLEKLIMLNVEHPFIVNMHYVFQKNYRIYFVMDYISGGELFNHIQI